MLIASQVEVHDGTPAPTYLEFVVKETLLETCLRSIKDRFVVS